MVKKYNFKTFDIVLSALFISLITVGAFIRIPIGLVPITLQIMFVFLAGQLLKWYTSLITGLVYICLGLVGLPVFAWGGGLGYILTPGFGYLIGFVFAMMIISFVCNRVKPTLLNLFFANIIGMITIYILAIGYNLLLRYFYLEEPFDLYNLVIFGFLVFVPTDLIFAFLSALISKRIRFTILNLK